MNYFLNKIGSNLFQTYFIEHTSDNTRQELLDYLDLLNIPTKNNPNLFHQVYNALTIDDANMLRSMHAEKGASSDKRIFLIEALGINFEAQSVFLKMLEEPKDNTHFFILLPQIDILPDTLKSRAHLIYEDKNESIDRSKPFENFFSSSPKDRIAIVSELVADHKKSETSAPLRNDARALLDTCEYMLRQSVKSIDTKTAWKLGEILKAKKYLANSGASVKLILEHIALVI